uniref:Fucolectin-6-like n=1 Tax=Saccoglossus kowalevskii TaxID=10224 RepID=A0ABM0MWQ0_SACKO|nr:PREDICTED: fucolectin-6-like [Saccoglossus kowalevskii]
MEESSKATNIAIGKPTEQSSTDWHAESRKAVDGDSDGEFCHGSCTLTKIEFDPWWKTNLLKSRSVYSISLKNREDCCSMRLAGAEIRVGNNEMFHENQLCGTVTSEMVNHGSVIDIQCNDDGAPIEGQFVSVQVKSKRGALSLCEVEVYAGEVDREFDVTGPHVTVGPPIQGMNKLK